MVNPWASGTTSQLTQLTKYRTLQELKRFKRSNPKEYEKMVNQTIDKLSAQGATNINVSETGKISYIPAQGITKSGMTEQLNVKKKGFVSNITNPQVKEYKYQLLSGYAVKAPDKRRGFVTRTEREMLEQSQQEAYATIQAEEDLTPSERESRQLDIQESKELAEAQGDPRKQFMIKQYYKGTREGTDYLSRGLKGIMNMGAGPWIFSQQALGGDFGGMSKGIFDTASSVFSLPARGAEGYELFWEHGFKEPITEKRKKKVMGEIAEIGGELIGGYALFKGASWGAKQALKPFKWGKSGGFANAQYEALEYPSKLSRATGYRKGFFENAPMPKMGKDVMNFFKGDFLEGKSVKLPTWYRAYRGLKEMKFRKGQMGITTFEYPQITAQKFQGWGRYSAPSILEIPKQRTLGASALFAGMSLTEKKQGTRQTQIEKMFNPTISKVFSGEAEKISQKTGQLSIPQERVIHRMKTETLTIPIQIFKEETATKEEQIFEEPNIPERRAPTVSEIFGMRPGKGFSKPKAKKERTPSVFKSSGYAPSLSGIFSEKRIRKAPKTVTMIEPRYPLFGKKKKKGRKFRWA